MRCSAFIALDRRATAPTRPRPHRRLRVQHRDAAGERELAHISARGPRPAGRPRAPAARRRAVPWRPAGSSTTRRSVAVGIEDPFDRGPEVASSWLHARRQAAGSSKVRPSASSELMHALSSRSAHPTHASANTTTSERWRRTDSDLLSEWIEPAARSAVAGVAGSRRGSGRLYAVLGKGPAGPGPPRAAPRRAGGRLRGADPTRHSW